MTREVKKPVTCAALTTLPLSQGQLRDRRAAGSGGALARERRAMITRICEGISQTQHVVTAHRHHPLSAVPGQIRLAYARQDQMGVDVGGGSTPYPHIAL